jgi:prevent-host-death family protein
MLTMFMVNIADAKAKLSEYVEAAARGERVLICNRNKPVAELRAVEQAPAQPRDLSPMYPGQTFMTDAFFEPMSGTELRQWYDTPVFPAEAPTRAAQKQPEYGRTRSGKSRKKTRRK